jgi:hypothetical protein
MTLRRNNRVRRRRGNAAECAETLILPCEEYSSITRFLHRRGHVDVPAPVASGEVTDPAC